MVARTDPIELLLPDAGDEARAHARRVATALRLLADDARAARAASVHVDLPRARAELLADAHARLRGALVDLVAAHARSAAGPGTFAAALLPEVDWARAWSVLERQRGERDDLPPPPAPDEPALSVAGRALDALERVDAELEGPAAERAGLERALWRAHLARAEHGPRAGERALAERAAAAADRPACDDLVRDALVGAAACMLDRGGVREAVALLGASATHVERDARLARLSLWAALLVGDEARARAAAARLGAWRGPLPRALCELRAAVPAWLACLSGREPGPADAARRPSGAARRARSERAAIGAAAACVFAMQPGGGARAVHVDVAPAWRGGLAPWLDERRDACAAPGEREHRMIVRGAAVIEHRRGAASLGGVLGGAATLAVAVVPIATFDAEVDPEPEPCGWLHLEFEHHLVPDAAALARLAARVRADRADRADRDRRAAHRAPDADAGARDVPPDVPPDGAGEDPRAEVFRRLVDALGVKTAVRRWWGFELDGSQLVPRAQGGGSQTLSGRPTGGRLALRRAHAAGGGVVFDEPDARLAVHARAASGVVVPLLLPGVGARGGARAVGFLALESERRRDFREADVVRFSELAGTAAMELWLAGFRGWHRARFGADLCFDAGLERARAAQLFGLARSRAPVAIVGPAGAGKTVLARELHYAAARLGAVGVDDLFELASEAALERELDRAAGGTLLIEEVEDLSPAAQARLARALDARRPRASRIVVTSRIPAGAGAEEERARVADALARRLDRLRLWVPPLCARRNEIPALVECLAARFAAEEGLARVRLRDEALALLWRQPWEGNLRELEGLVHRLALLHAGAAVGPDEVLETARRFRCELVPRLSSRKPEPEAIRAALDLTRTGGGRINKTRAALYLGWDPDTLVARLDELGLEGGTAGRGGEPEPRAG